MHSRLAQHVSPRPPHVWQIPSLRHVPLAHTLPAQHLSPGAPHVASGVVFASIVPPPSIFLTDASAWLIDASAPTTLASIAPLPVFRPPQPTVTMITPRPMKLRITCSY